MNLSDIAAQAAMVRADQRVLDDQLRTQEHEAAARAAAVSILRTDPLLVEVVSINEFSADTGNRAVIRVEDFTFEVRVLKANRLDPTMTFLTLREKEGKPVLYAGRTTPIKSLADLGDLLARITEHTHPDPHYRVS